MSSPLPDVDWEQELPLDTGVAYLNHAAGDAKRRAGIVTFVSERVDNATLYSNLIAGGVICAQRGGGIRLSPHF
jgi:hypothetical protein